VERLVCIGTGAVTSAQAVAVARATAGAGAGPRAWASVGLHPHQASEGVDEVAALLARELAADDGVVVAVGECGLDYFYEHSPRQAQRAAFAAQIALAHRYGLALVIHARDAWTDLFEVLAAEGVPERTVLHCFTGGPDEVERCLRAGMYVSFSGIVTFKNASDVREAAARCPLDRLLVETDSPFLAPVPHRGRANEPSYLPFVGEAIATIKGCTADEVRERTAAATAMVFSTEG
jgi:TatD DNase family protein